jgi:hypothetical protein
MEKKIEEGIFGEGAGIEYVAAGGLHTVFIDEKGTVCEFLLTSFSNQWLGLDMWYKRQRCSRACYGSCS